MRHYFPVFAMLGGVLMLFALTMLVPLGFAWLGQDPALFAYDEFSGVTRDAWRALRDEHRDAANLIGSLVDADAPDDLSVRNGTGLHDLLIVGFGRTEYLENPEVGAALGVLLSTQINQLALVQGQLELAENIEALIAEERAK